MKNQSPGGGIDFTVPGVNELADLHGDIIDPDLTIFFGGNQFMVLPELMAAFQARHPEVVRIYYETLPPGVLEEQLKSGSLLVGDLRIEIEPDLFIAGKKLVTRLRQEGFCSRITPYLKNSLAIMVAGGNPRQIRSLEDLGRNEIRVSMPDPEREGVALKILEAMRKAGGDELVRQIMSIKRENQTTFLTRIHHRQTPTRILEDRSDAGPVWATEVRYQQMIGRPIEGVAIEEAHNISGTTAAATLEKAPHPRAAEQFLDFLLTNEAGAIYRRYGFEPCHDL